MVEGEEIDLEEKETEVLLAQTEEHNQERISKERTDQHAKQESDTQKIVVKEKKSVKQNNKSQSQTKIVKAETIVASNHQVVGKSSKSIVKENNLSKNNKQKVSNKKRSSKAKLNKKTTVYKIHILTCDELLRAGDERFCGLKPIKCKLCDGKYLYTYGESESEKDMESLLKTVKAKIPLAYVIKDFKTVK